MAGGIVSTPTLVDNSNGYLVFVTGDFVGP